jgi:hypothetical protein
LSERRREKEYTFIIRSNICERFLSKKKGRSRLCCERAAPKRKKEEKKEKFRRQKEQLLSFQALFFALKRL